MVRNVAAAEAGAPAPGSLAVARRGADGRSITLCVKPRRLRDVVDGGQGGRWCSWRLGGGRPAGAAMARASLCMWRGAAIRERREQGRAVRHWPAAGPECHGVQRRGAGLTSCTPQTPFPNHPHANAHIAHLLLMAGGRTDGLFSGQSRWTPPRPAGTSRGAGRGRTASARSSGAGACVLTPRCAAWTGIEASVQQPAVCERV